MLSKKLPIRRGENFQRGKVPTSGMKRGEILSGNVYDFFFSEMTESIFNLIGNFRTVLYSF